MLPFVMLPRPLQESNVVGKGGTAGFLGRAYDPLHALPARRRHGHEQDGPHPHRRPAIAAARSSPTGSSGGPRLRETIDAGMPAIDKAVASLQARRVLRAGLEPDRLRPGPRGLRPGPGTGQSRATATAATPSAKAVCWPGGWSRPARASSRSIWPKVANSDNHSWDHHVGLTDADEEPVGPDARYGACRP